jgi:hypothetical protein
MCIALLFLQPRLGWVVNATPRPLYSRERPGTVQGLVGPRAGLDGCGKSRRRPPPPGIDPRIVQPVASRYIDCAIPAPTIVWRPNNYSSGSRRRRMYFFF